MTGLNDARQFLVELISQLFHADVLARSRQIASRASGGPVGCGDLHVDGGDLGTRRMA